MKHLGPSPNAKPQKLNVNFIFRASIFSEFRGPRWRPRRRPPPGPRPGPRRRLRRRRVPLRGRQLPRRRRAGAAGQRGGRAGGGPDGAQEGGRRLHRVGALPLQGIPHQEDHLDQGRYV